MKNLPVKFSSEKADSATELEFARLQEIKTLFPEGEITLRTHTAACESCDATETRTGVLVVIKSGEFEFRREFAC